MIISGMEQLRCSPPLISPPVRSSDNACGVTASGVSALPAHHRSADAQNPRSHLILDNYATHKHDQVKLWLDKHPRFHLHFTPTSALWLNLVERFFGLITQERIRRGVFTSLDALETAIREYLDNHNAAPSPFVWTKSADQILAKVERARNALEAVQNAN